MIHASFIINVTFLTCEINGLCVGVQAVGMWITDKFKHQIQISVLDFKMKHRMQY